MECIYAAMILHKAGKKVDEDSVKKVLEAAGSKVDENRIKALISTLQGVNIEKAIENIKMPESVITTTEVKAADKPKEKPKEEKAKEDQASKGMDLLFN